MAAATIQRKDTHDTDGLVSREELEDVAGVVQYRRFDGDLVLVEERPATPEETVAYREWQKVANAEELRAQGEKALGKNQTFLALDPPTNAQIAAQVEALTKQMNGLIRQILHQWDDIADAVLEEAP
jgi:hypothetical protein